jgi:hypothetical protein
MTADVHDSPNLRSKYLVARRPASLFWSQYVQLDGAAARNRVLNTETFATAAAIAAVLVDNAIPEAAVPAQASPAELSAWRM